MIQVVAFNTFQARVRVAGHLGRAITDHFFAVIRNSIADLKPRQQQTDFICGWKILDTVDTAKFL
jgi:hypothetical protein